MANKPFGVRVVNDKKGIKGPKSEDPAFGDQGIVESRLRYGKRPEEALESRTVRKAKKLRPPGTAVDPRPPAGTRGPVKQLDLLAESRNAG